MRYVLVLVLVAGLLGACQLGEKSEADKLHELEVACLTGGHMWNAASRTCGPTQTQPPTATPTSEPTVTSTPTATPSPTREPTAPITKPSTDTTNRCPRATDTALAHAQNAYERSQARNYEGAITDLTIAICLDPQFAIAYSNRGLAYYRLGQYEQAIHDYDAAIRLDPQDATVYNSRGLAYSSLDHYQAAIQDFDTAIWNDPQYALAYNSRGRAYSMLGQYERAVQDYDTAIRIEPKIGTLYSNRAYALAYLGRDSEAQQDVERAVALGWDRAALEAAINHAKAQVSYTVKSGDTVTDIASRYDVAVADLLQFNNLCDGSLIHPGQSLKIPSASFSSSPATDTACRTPQPSATSQAQPSRQTDAAASSAQPNNLISATGLAWGEQCDANVPQLKQMVMGDPFPKQFCYVIAVDWWPANWIVTSIWRFPGDESNPIAAAQRVMHPETLTSVPCKSSDCTGGYIRHPYYCEEAFYSATGLQSCNSPLHVEGSRVLWGGSPGGTTVKAGTGGTLEIDLFVNGDKVRTDYFLVMSKGRSGY